MLSKNFSPFDKLIIQADSALRTVFGNPTLSNRPYPAENCTNNELNEHERKHASALMRINHAGEVSAQGLYQGQALTAKLPKVRARMEQAAIEENDHLIWCENRLKALNARKSILNPVWYTGSFILGAAAGILGDKWSLGFVAETEHQVVKHLNEHLASISKGDICSRAVLKQMKIDEAEHATTALLYGGEKLPAMATKAMGLMSKVMTKTTYWI